MVDNGERGVWGQDPGGPPLFGPAHEEFQARLRSAWPSATFEGAVNDAFAAYAAIVREPWESADLRQRASDAYAECNKRVREAFANGGAERVLDAYRQYVQQLKRVWASLDPEALPPTDLASLAQGMSWVASAAIEVTASAASTAGHGSRS